MMAALGGLELSLEMSVAVGGSLSDEMLDWCSADLEEKKKNERESEYTVLTIAVTSRMFKGMNNNDIVQLNMIWLYVLYDTTNI